MRSRVITLLALTLAVGCSQSNIYLDAPGSGVVSVTVGLSASEVGAATVSFVVSHPTALPQPIPGTVAVADPVTSFTLTQIPVVDLGDPYTLSLIAEKTDGTWVCEGNTTFEHSVQGVTTSVVMTMTCPTSDTLPNGEVGVDITFQLNFCPVVEEFSATPEITVLMNPVALSALASDPDNTAPVTYAWSATSGAITAPTAANTTYICTAMGDHTVTLVVSDSDTACDQERQLRVSCTADPNCGNGTREVTEFCDDGVNDGGEGECLNCTTIQVCGDGTANGDEGCDDSGQSAVCDADCTLAACQDGTLNISAGEICDDGAQSATCDTDCTVALCGDGVVNTDAGETCDTSGPSPTCTAQCLGTS
jgi:hypothetical protein